MDRYHRAYYVAFLVALAVCWSPLNLLAYLAPAIFIAVYVTLTGSMTVVRNVLIWLMVFGLAIFIHAPFVRQFALHSALLAIVTYSSFAVLFVIPGRFLRSPQLYTQMIKWVRWVVVVQALWGIAQGLYGFSQTGSFDLANGDFVEGTIHPALASEASFSNPMFAVNMSLMLIVLLPPLVLRRKGLLPVVLGAIALTLASVLHVLLFTGIALVLALLLYRPRVLRRKTSVVVLTSLVVVAIAARVLLPRNFSTVAGFTRLLISGESYRSEVIGRAVWEMPREYWLMPVAGLGPGQFSSRAGLIGTGLFFGGPQNPRPVPLLPQGMSAAFRENVLDVWLEISERAASGVIFGSTHQPFLSWLSVYVEMGAIVFLGIFIVAFAVLWRVKRHVRSYVQKIMATALGAGTIFLLLLGVQENYWEVPQAILIGLLLLKVLYANLVYWSPAEAENLV